MVDGEIPQIFQERKQSDSEMLTGNLGNSGMFFNICNFTIINVVTVHTLVILNSFISSKIHDAIPHCTVNVNKKTPQMSLRSKFINSSRLQLHSYLIPPRYSMCCRVKTRCLHYCMTKLISGWIKAGQEWMVLWGHTGGPKEFYNLAKGWMDSGPSQSIYWCTL